MWIKLKFSFNSDRLEYINNHTMGVVTDNESYEKIIIFGGIQNTIQKDSKDAGNVLSFLSNKCYLVSIQQRSSGKSFFKEGEAPI